MSSIAIIGAGCSGLAAAHTLRDAGYVVTVFEKSNNVLPSQKADANALNALTLPHGLAFCGDAFVGGRVHLAMEHGARVAKELG